MTQTSPKHLIAIVGTNTEVGKTWIGCKILRLARAAGLRVAARKPAQSFAAGDTSATDAELLATASGESPHDVCPAHRWYRMAMAPPMAADALRQARITLEELTNELQWPADADVGVIETAGGLLSPIAHDGDNLELLRAIKPDRVLLVADAGLGTINAVRLSLRALTDFVTCVVLNRYDIGDELHRRNRDWLREQYGVNAAIDAAECWENLRAR